MSNKKEVLINRDELLQHVNHYRYQEQEMENLAPPPGSVNYYGGHGPPSNGTHSTQGVVVSGEEIGIVLVVLILWVGAIILFFNRWGKIRMLEPYQPKFCEGHLPNCPMADVPVIPSYPRTFSISKFNLTSETASPHFSKCNYHGVTAATSACATEPLLNGGPGMGGGGGGSGGHSGHHHMGNHRGSRSMSISMMGGLGVPSSLNLQGGQGGSSSLSPRLCSGGRGSQNRLRQNSVFVTSPSNFPVSIFGEGGGGLSSQLGNKGTAGGRKTKSAVDLSTLVLCGEIMDNVRRNSKNSITNL